MSVSLEFRAEDQLERWLLEEEDVPETPLHDAIIALLKLVLEGWVARRGASALVARNLGCSWEPSYARVGMDPDIALIEPAPPEGEGLSTLRVWLAGHAPPRLAVEVVSEHGAEKDYLDAPARCARLGARELWVFYPQLLGPTGTGGPYRLQVWRRVGAERLWPTPAEAEAARAESEAARAESEAARAEALAAEVARLKAQLGET